MTTKKQLKIAVIIAIHLLLIGIVCYAAFPTRQAEPPDPPPRVFYTTPSGNVLFDHKSHAPSREEGLSCWDCHHHIEDEEDSLIACGECHQKLAEGEDFPESCMECHDEDEIEDTQIIKRSDALHQQCAQCHEEYGAGPLYIESDCAKCHSQYK